MGGDFSMDVEVWEEADGFGMMQVRYIYCALYFYSNSSKKGRLSLILNQKDSPHIEQMMLYNVI